MRYMGNKYDLLGFIQKAVWKTGVEPENGVFCDLFAGTGTVGRHFKEEGFRVIANDILYFSYLLNRPLEMNLYPEFSALANHYGKAGSRGLFGDCQHGESIAVDICNGLKPVEGFVYQHYTMGGTKGKQYERMFYSDENGRRIDAIRQKISEWRLMENELLALDEHDYLLACLIEAASKYANNCGLFSGHLKELQGNARQPLMLAPVSVCIKDRKPPGGYRQCKVFNTNAVELAGWMDTKGGCNYEPQIDILYLDPPYNERQYIYYYHLLETIADYDHPAIRRKGGLRPFEGKLSRFCQKKTALEDLDAIAKCQNYKHLMLSYSNEGIMPHEDIVELLQKHGTELKVLEAPHKRYKSHHEGEEVPNAVKERIYWLRRD